jgi:tripartite-type tricarboxylate transporter receptor subunit TctC
MCPGLRSLAPPGLEVIGWASVFAPADMPADIVTKLNRTLNTALAQLDVKEREAAWWGHQALARHTR